MKTRIFTFMFAACLVSSLAFADNPADAPLSTDDASSVAVQPSCATHHRMLSEKKVKTSATPVKKDSSATADRHGKQGTPATPAIAGN